MKRQIIATLGAAVLMASAVASSSAVPAPVSSNTDVDIVVTSTGVLSVSIAETEPFDDIRYSFDRQTVEGDLTIQVTDQRGTAAGWTFNLRGTGDFTGRPTGPGDSFPLSGLGLRYTSVSVDAGNPDTSGITGSGVPQVSTTGQQVATASPDSGNGQYDLLYDGTLSIPGDTLVDTYSTTIIVEVPANP